MCEDELVVDVVVVVGFVLVKVGVASVVDVPTIGRSNEKERVVRVVDRECDSWLGALEVAGCGVSVEEEEEEESGSCGNGRVSVSGVAVRDVLVEGKV